MLRKFVFVLVLMLVFYGGNALLFGQNARQISDGTMGRYEAFPDLRKLFNGDLLLVYYAGENHIDPNGKIITRRSSDYGITWSKPEVLINLEGDDRDPSLFQTSKGTLLCNFMTYYGRDKNPAFAVRIIRSTDSGQTWSKPIEISSPFKKVTANSSPIIELQNGDLLLPIYGRETENGFHSNKVGQRDRVAFLRSKDDGLTWKDPVILEENNTEQHQEPALLRMDDGRLLCIVRPKGGISWSSDNGHTWSPVKYLKADIDCPYLFAIDDNTLICGIRNRGAKNEISVMVSRDKGETWSAPQTMAVGWGAYPSIQKIRDNIYAFVYYRDKPGPSRIWMIYFQLNEDGTVHRFKIDEAFSLLRAKNNQ